MAGPWEQDWDTGEYEGADTDTSLPWNQDWGETTPESQFGDQGVQQGPATSKRVEGPTTQKYGQGMGHTEALSRSDRLKGMEGKEGGDVRTRLAASVGTQEDIKRQLALQFGGNADEFEIGNYEGDLLFRHPEFTGGELRPIDEVGIDKGDWAVLAPEAAVIAGEIGGGIAGSKLGPGGVVPGAAAGAGVTRSIIQKGLEHFEVLEEGNAVVEGLKEGAISLGGGGLVAGGRMAKQVFFPSDKAYKSIDPTLGPKGVTDEPSLTELIERGEAELADTGAPYTTGQVVAAAEGGEEVGRRIQASERAAQDQQPFIDIARKQEEARGNILDTLRPLDEVDEEAVGQVIRQRGFERYELDSAKIADEAGREVENTYRHIDEIMRSDGATGQTIRETIQEGRDKVYDRLGDQYEALWENIPAGTQPDLTNLRSTAVEWQARLDRQVFKSLSEEDALLVKDAIKSVENVSKKGSDLVDLQRDLTALKKERLKLDQLPGMSRQKAIIDDFITDIEAARYTAMEKIDPELAEGVLALDRAWATAKADIDEGLAGAILAKKKGGRYKVEDDRVLDTALANRDDLVHYLEIGQKYPELNALPDLKLAFNAKYMRDVVDGGMTHRAFMRKNQSVMDTLLNEKELGAFSTANKAKQHIKNVEAQENKMLNSLSAEFGQRVSRMDPDQAVDYAMKSVTTAKRLKRILPPDEWKVYQDVRRKRLVEDITLGGDVQLRNLERQLSGKRYDELRQSLGQSYMNDLRKLEKLMKASQKKPGAALQLPTSEQAGDLVGFIKGMIFGPLTTKGYKIGRTQRFASSNVNKEIERLLANPTKLKQALELKNASLHNRKWWNLMGSLGFNIGAMAIDARDPNIPIIDREQIKEMAK